LLKQTLNLSAVLQNLTAFYTKAINFAFNGRTAGTSATTGSTCPRYMIWQAGSVHVICDSTKKFWSDLNYFIFHPPMRIYNFFSQGCNMLL